MTTNAQANSSTRHDSGSGGDSGSEPLTSARAR